ncbi:hypothetical protein IKF84_03290 [Candidatus Saccharibacteria bacterium]|nr:hypothetical protein [Candidatus Saccharibacteria bacterium]
MMRNTPPDKWPPIDELVETSKKLSRDEQRVVFSLIFNAFSARLHRKLTDKEQAAIWDGFSDESLHCVGTREKYIKNRLNNEVMWLPENLRAKASKKSSKYQAACKEFFEEKSSEWQEIPVEDLEDWLRESKEEFREIINEL